MRLFGFSSSYSSKRSSAAFAVVLGALALSGCSINPATGDKQFAALMSPQQENTVGASEHEKIIDQFGLLDNAAITSYVNEVGQKVVRDTERPDVQYKFFVLDSPIVNAFALPGGYIYVSRGLLALANSEAELAAVLAHETGHVTARHSAERYSTSVVTSLGAGLLSAAIGGGSGVSQALDIGSNLYLSSYSRGQERQADSLGLRYMTRGGYDSQAMPAFLASLQAEGALENRIAGRQGSPGASYFSTHPATDERVSQTGAETQNYPPGGTVNRERHLRTLDGMIYGDSPAHGFARGLDFYHPGMGFTFSVPEGFTITNQPAQVVATSASGGIMLFDLAQGTGDPLAYVQNWVKEAPPQDMERITVNGMQAATGSFAGQINGRPATIRLVAIAWNGRMARFQIAIPAGTSTAEVEGLRRATYSFRSMSAQEKQAVKPYRVRIFTAKAGETVSSVAQTQPFTSLREERFRLLNGLRPGDTLQTGQLYKRIEG
ncbi:MAG: M48 family metalloprotease [Alphaproteobacteria bacterium]|nr:M48 family metalloprotease [Alphaproteobacteria bacterium]